MVPILALVLANTPLQGVHAQSVQPSSSNNVTVLSQQPEETNLNTLYDRAIHGKSDIPIKDADAAVKLTKVNGSKSISSLTASNNLTTKKYSTAQILKTTKSGDTTTQDVALTTFVTVQPMASGSINDSKYDSTYSVKAYSTVYYSTSTINGASCIKFVKVVGGWNQLDSQVSLSGRTTWFGCSGPSSKTGIAIDQNTTKTTSANSFTYTAPTSWIYVIKSGITSCSATLKVTIHRGGSSWTLQLTNSAL